MSAETNNMCELCNANTMKYSCPRCNILYCSVKCYKHPDHSHCSEDFYRECIASEMSVMAKDSEVVDQKRDSMRRMYDILARVEQDNNGGTDYGESSEDEGDSNLDSDDNEVDEMSNEELAKRLENVNLNNADEVWLRLTEEEREEFNKLIRNDEIGTIAPEFKPWWKNIHTSALIEEIVPDTQAESKSVKAESTTVPKLCENIRDFNEIHAKAPHPSARYNIMNILGAYSSMVRYFDGDHQSYPHEACHRLISICANLRENQIFPSEAAAIDSVIDAIRQDVRPFNDGIIENLQGDLNALLYAKPGSNIPTTTFPLKESNIFVLTSLSDIFQLISAAKSLPTETVKGEFHRRFLAKGNHVKYRSSQLSGMLRKVEYFLSYANSFPIG